MANQPPKIKVIEGFLPPEDCAWLIAQSKEANLWSISNDIGDSIVEPELRKDYKLQWDDRIIDLHRLYDRKIEPELMSRTWDILSRSKTELFNFFELSGEIYLDSWEVVRWFPPISQNPHLDFIEPDFDRTKDFPEGFDHSYFTEEAERMYRLYNTTKHYTTMLYLNEDFEGGEIYFPQYGDFDIKPKPGMLVIFSGDFHHLHGVREIKKGVRYTNTAFWSRYPTFTTVARELRDGIFKPYW